MQSLTELRTEISSSESGSDFHLEVVQCPAQFFEKLVSTHPYDLLEQKFSVTLEQYNTCVNSDCSHSTPVVRVDSCYFSLESSSHARNVQSLVEFSLQDRVLEESNACSFYMASFYMVLLLSGDIVPHPQQNMSMSAFAFGYQNGSLVTRNSFNCCISWMGILLLLSGDVELNPGPKMSKKNVFHRIFEHTFT